MFEKHALAFAEWCVWTQYLVRVPVGGIATAVDVVDGMEWVGPMLAGAAGVLEYYRR